SRPPPRGLAERREKEGGAPARHVGGPQRKGGGGKAGAPPRPPLEARGHAPPAGGAGREYLPAARPHARVRPRGAGDDPPGGVRLARVSRHREHGGRSARREGERACQWTSSPSPRIRVRAS